MFSCPIQCNNGFRFDSLLNLLLAPAKRRLDHVVVLLLRDALLIPHSGAIGGLLEETDHVMHNHRVVSVRDAEYTPRALQRKRMRSFFLERDETPTHARQQLALNPPVGGKRFLGAYMDFAAVSIRSCAVG